MFTLRLTTGQYFKAVGENAQGTLDISVTDDINEAHKYDTLEDAVTDASELMICGFTVAGETTYMYIYPVEIKPEPKQRKARTPKAKAEPKPKFKPVNDYQDWSMARLRKHAYECCKGNKDAIRTFGKLTMKATFIAYLMWFDTETFNKENV